RIEPWVGRRQHDDAPSRGQVRGGLLHLGAIVLNVFEHVDVEDGLKTRRRSEVRDGPARGAETRVSGGKVTGNLRGQRGVRLETQPGIEIRLGPQRRIGSDTGAHLDHITSKKRLDLTEPVALPVYGLGEKPQLASGVGEVTHGKKRST